LPQELQNILNPEINLTAIVINLCVAFICGLIISYVYRIVYKGPSYTVSFVQSIVLLSIITSIVISVIGNNLARAFGLVGAMSIIRFRTAVRDAIDIVFIFLSLAVGLAAGVGLRTIALTGTVFTCLVILLLSKFSYGTPKRNEVLLQFTAIVNDKETMPPYQGVLERFCKKIKLINIKSNGGGYVAECFYHVTLKDVNTGTEFVTALKKVEGINNVNLFFDKD
jgi:uncharacterized membrane protein YhiD involved in acid resistance